MSSAHSHGELGPDGEARREGVATPQRIAFFGGIYSNYLALAAALEDAHRRGVTRIYCLGDLGAFGPFPDRVFPLLQEHEVECVQGNYDDSVGRGLEDCQCGYTDPRDNHFARLSYAYTLANTSLTHRAWLRSLPPQRRIELGPYRLYLCHGSPRRTNEFLWSSTTPTQFLDLLLREYACDILLATHTGLKWHRPLADGKHFLNVGVLGRPENDGTPRVWYTLLEYQAAADGGHAGSFRHEFVPVDYDHERLAAEMEAESLPAEFVETIRSGWWTTCLEILPSKERKRGRY